MTNSNRHENIQLRLTESILTGNMNEYEFARIKKDLSSVGEVMRDVVHESLTSFVDDIKETGITFSDNQQEQAAKIFGILAGYQQFKLEQEPDLSAEELDIKSTVHELEDDSKNDTVRGLFYTFIKNGTGANELHKIVREIDNQIRYQESGSTKFVEQLFDETVVALKYDISDAHGFAPDSGQLQRLTAINGHLKRGFKASIAKNVLITRDISNGKVDSLSSERLADYGRRVRAINQQLVDSE